MDWIMVFAVLVAPLLAIQASQYLDRRRDRKSRKLEVFRQLMATRAARLSTGHVEALNVIDIEFYDQKKITEAWKAYLDHLGDRALPREQWGPRGDELLVELLYEMAKHLGYSFDKTHIKRAAYFPEGYGDYEADQHAIRKALVKILAGEIPLPITIESSLDEDRAKAQTEMAESMKRFFSGETIIRIALAGPLTEKAPPS